MAGYHDAKLTVLRVEEDGSIGEITEEISIRDLAVLRSAISVPTSTA